MRALMNRKNASMGMAAVLALATLGVVPAVQAANATWTGTTDATWQTGTNWNPAPAPGSTAVTTSTDIATFNINSHLTVTPDANRNLGSINFDTAAGNFVIGTTGGNPLFLTTGGTTQILSTLTATNAIETINAPLVLEGATYTFTNASANGAGANAGTLNFGGGITGAAGNTVLTLAGANTNSNTISGVIGNGSATSMGITKSGAGTWLLAGANTYTGPTNITAGTLAFQTQASLYTGNSTNWTAANITVASGATMALQVSANPAYFTSTALDTLLDGSHLGASTATTGLTAGAILGLDTTQGDFTYNTAIASTNSIVLKKLGANVLTLGGANTYTGTTTVSAGAVLISGSGTLGATTAAVTLAGGSIDLGTTTQTVGAVSINNAAGIGNTLQNGTLTGTSYTGANTSGNAIVTTNLGGTGSTLTENGYEFSGRILYI